MLLKSAENDFTFELRITTDIFVFLRKFYIFVGFKSKKINLLIN